jgi:hypothetical protein
VNLRIAVPVCGFILERWDLFGGSAGDASLPSDFFHRSQSRSAFFILSVGAVLSAVTGCQRAPAPDVMATVNGKEILSSEVEKYYRANLGENQG